MFKLAIEMIGEIVGIIISVMILRIYFKTFFEKIERTFYSVACWGIFILWQIVSSHIQIVPSYINILISILLTIIICITTYNGPFLQQIVFSVLINAIWMLAELMIGYIFIFAGIPIRYTIPQLMGSILSKSLTLFLIVILEKFFKNENMSNLSNKYNILFLMIPLGSMFIVYNIFVLSGNSDKGQYMKQSLASSLLVLLMNIIVFKLYINLSKEKELQKYNMVYEQQLELCNQHMQEKENILLDFRNARHDMKQHFLILLELLKSNKYELATEYLNKLVNMNIFNSGGISRTDNIVVDSLINAKYSIARKSNIKFEVNFHIPMQLPFSGADLGILLGNILDNAIEASIEIPEQQREIKCYMKYENNFLVITVVNAFNGVLHKNKNGKILTKKKDSQNHGIGLESVQKISEKYHGSVVIEEKNNYFVIKVLLCDLSQKLQVNS